MIRWYAISWYDFLISFILLFFFFFIWLGNCLCRCGGANPQANGFMVNQVALGLQDPVVILPLFKICKLMPRDLYLN